MLLRDYRGLVELYSYRSLTYGSDKLPAFTGIASCLHETLGTPYLAGIWASDIVNGLLWKPELSECKHVKPFRAPTWSWAATDDAILYETYGGSIGETMASTSVILIDHEIIISDPSNPSGEISSASIVVRGLTLSLIRSEQYIGNAKD